MPPSSSASVSSILVITGSTRPRRVGPAVAEWVGETVTAHPEFALHTVDLAELGLPMLDEPAHPRLRQYEHAHTHAWSERIDAADAVIFVIPEYNHSFTAPVKNAIDFLAQEWAGKPVGMVGYGGLAGGTRAIMALEAVWAVLGARRARTNVEIAFVAEHVDEWGRFVPTDSHGRALRTLLGELQVLAG